MSAVQVVTLTRAELEELLEEAAARGAARAAPTPPPAKSHADELVPVAVAAKACGCSADTILAMIRTGKLPERRAGAKRGHHRVRISEVEEAMRRRTERPAPVDPEAAVVRMLARRR